MSLRRLLRMLVAVLTVVGAVGVARAAWATGEISTSATSTAEVGTPFEVQLKATSTQEMPSEPRLGEPPSISAGPPVNAPRRMVSIVNGVRNDQLTLRTTWRVTAARQGIYTFNPSVMVDGARRRAQPVIVQVVPAGTLPRGQQPSPFDPFNMGPGFDPFQHLLRPFDLEPPEPPQVSGDPHLGLPAPRGRGAFLHATVDRTSAVIGEQVTLSVYLYIDTQGREPDFNDIHEATTSDFERRSLLDDDAPTLRTMGHARVGSGIWTVKLVRRLALFPLKTGRLTIGPMTFGVVAGGSGVANKRESETLDVNVSEPPAAGRPAGYAAGDVGHFKLAATVEPRQIERGGAATVTVELSGTGNLPGMISPPTRRELEWLVPEVREKMGNAGNDRWGGKRTFTFVVRGKEAGQLDLGALRLPYFDPDTRAYAVTEAALGTLDVAPGAAGDAPDAGAPVDPFANLPAPRKTRGSAAVASSHVTDLTAFWALLLTPPAAFVVVAGGRFARRRLRQRLDERKSSPRAELTQRLAEADSAVAGSDPRAADAAIARAIETAARVRLDVRLRAATSREAEEVLVARGVSADAARTIADTLAATDAARFSPEAAPMNEVRDRWSRTKAALASLAVLLLLGWAAPAGADEADDAFLRAREALEAGRPSDAIGELEALADRGVVDDAVSFNRGLAYVQRVHLGGEQPGDVGRAAHGFEEARILTRDAQVEGEATRALGILRAEVARRRSRAGVSVELDHSALLGDSIAELVPENVWAGGAALASLVTGAGLFVRWGARRRRLRVAGSVAIAVAAPLLVAFAGLAWSARDLRLHRREAVVVTATARPSDAAGIAMAKLDPLPEGARVRVLDANGSLTLVRWGAIQGWVPPNALRHVARR